jgi:hypothetical protein
MVRRRVVFSVHVCVYVCMVHYSLLLVSLAHSPMAPNWSRIRPAPHTHTHTHTHTHRKWESTWVSVHHYTSLLPYLVHPASYLAFPYSTQSQPTHMHKKVRGYTVPIRTPQQRWEWVCECVSDWLSEWVTEWVSEYLLHSRGLVHTMRSLLDVQLHQ